MKKGPVVLLLLVYLQMAAQPDPTPVKPLDSLFSILKTEVSNMSSTHTNEQTYQKAYFALARALHDGNPEKIAQAHNIIADWHYYSVTSNNPDSVYFHDLKTLEYLRMTDDQSSIAKAEDRVGKDLVNMGRYPEAEQYLFNVVRIYESLNEPLHLGSAYASLNFLFRETQDYSQALVYGEKSMELFEANYKDEDELIEPLLGLIKTYPEVGKPELALEKAQQVVDIISRKYGEGENIHMANVRVWRGEVYVALKQYDNALEDFNYSYQVMKNLLPDESDADGWKGYIGNVLRLQGKYAAAIPYIKDCLHHHQSKNIEAWKLIEDNQFWLAECFEKTNQPDSAFRYLQQGQQTQKDRLTEELAAVKKELRIKYDTDEKEETIQTQQARIQQQSQVQYLSYGVVASLLGLLVVGFIAYRNNRKKNRQLLTLNQDLTQSNHQLDQRNAQNELLLKEIHHRVKNNLEIISSLLELQARQTDDQVAQFAMKESQSRVRSMGILHQKLFQGQNQVAIEMKDYFTNLSNHLLDTYDAGEKVKVDCKMDPLELDIDTAIPIGLIVNEVLTNALKYAFRDRNGGKIRLSLQAEGDRNLNLSIEDDGVGKQHEGQPEGTGFGTQLINLLTHQLEGSMSEQIREGTKISFHLKKVRTAS